MKHNHTRSLLIAAAIAVQVLCTMGLNSALAQQQPVPVVVGVINADGIMRDSKAGKNLQAQADQQQKAIKADYAKQQKQYEDAAQKLAAQRDTLSAEDLQKKREDLKGQMEQASKKLSDRQRNLEQSFTKGQDKILEALVGVVEDVAKAHGMTLVISRAQVAYFDPSYDISQEVMQKLNAKLPSMKLQQASDAQ